MALTLEEANRMLQAAVTRARERNFKLSVVVVDAGGHLLAFNRMDGANWATATVVQGKAVTSAGFGRPSGFFQTNYTPVVQAVMANYGGRMLADQGGVPIFRNGELVGAIACSGASSQQDEECAQAGAAAL